MKNRRIDVQKLISHRLPLEKINEAYRLASRDKNCLKVIITNGD